MSTSKHGLFLSKTEIPFSLLPTTNGPPSPDSFTRLNMNINSPTTPRSGFSGFSVMNRAGSFKTRAAVTSPTMPMTEEMSFYDLLGIPETGTTLDIKQAYKQLARKYHPDVSPPDRVDEYTERFIMVQEAYETLSDPRRRALYDSDMAKGLHLAFSARRRYHSDEDDQMEGRGEWKNRWQSQLSDLKKRSMYKDNTSSWAAQMRKQRSESS